MPQSPDIEKDPFLVLLTDALRAGPGSPEWRDAVAKLKVAGADGTDEYRLLIEAREALESGKEYRSVQAGPGFTRKLLTHLEREPHARTSRWRFPLAGFIATVAGLVILGAIALIVYKLVPRNPVNPGTRSGIDDLQSTYFPTQVLATSFDAGALPPGWRTIGSLPVTADKGLRPGDAAVPEGGYIGGGIVMVDPLAAAQPFSAQVTLRIQGTGEALIPQIFVANSPDFSPDRATGQQELVWQLQGNEQKVVVGGRVEKQSPIPGHAQTLKVRLILNKDLAIVESDGRRLWAGPNALGDRPRYLGVRFLRTSGKSNGDVSVQSVQVQKS
jgi:hypothetical protein